MPGIRLVVSALTLVVFSALLVGVLKRSASREGLSAKAGRASLPALKGDEAIESLKQQGLYESLGEALAAAWYKVSLGDGSKDAQAVYRAPNPAQGFDALFTTEGISIRPRPAPDPTAQKARWQTALSLTGYGYENDFVALSAPALEARPFRSQSKGGRHGPRLRQLHRRQGHQRGARHCGRRPGQSLPHRHDKYGQFPQINLPQPPFLQGDAAFAVRVAADGNSLEYSGVIDGDNDEEGNGIAVDGVGNAYLVGTTNSRTDGGFPANVGPGLNADCPADCPRSNDAFVAKINANGTSLGYCRYIGGSRDDRGKAIAVDSQGRAYVTGKTDSDERFPSDQFPVRVGPDRTYNGSDDAFIARVTDDGIFLEYCGYIGGGNLDEGNGIAVDGSGSAYVIGTTSSVNLPDGNSIGRGFPSPNPFISSGTDAFVVKVNASGSGFVYAGYIGGFGHEEGRGIAIDGDRNAYVTGFTESSAASFPDGDGIGDLPGPDHVLLGTRDAFIVRVNSLGTAFDLATYIGGANDEEGNGIAMNAVKNAYVTGLTNSPLLDSVRNPIPASPDRSFNGGLSDAFVEKISAGQINPPAVSFCPSNILVTTAPGEDSAVVIYPLPDLTSLGGGVVFASHLPGSLFRAGTTVVNMTAVTPSGTFSCSFTVTVLRG